MGKQLDSEIDIAADPQRGRQVLSEFTACPDWNPFLVRVAWKPEAGGRLTVRMQPVGSRPVTLRPTALEAAAFVAMNEALERRAERAMTP